MSYYWSVGALRKVMGGMASNDTGLVTFDLSASGESGIFYPRSWKALNLTLSGTWTGTVSLMRSFDGGTTWFPCTLAGSALDWDANISEPVWEEPEDGVQIKIAFAWISGTLTGRISQ